MNCGLHLIIYMREFEGIRQIFSEERGINAFFYIKYQLLLRSAIEVLFIYFIVFINSQFLYMFLF